MTTTTTTITTRGSHLHVYKFLVVDFSVSVEVEHFEGNFEVARGQRQDRQKKNVVCECDQSVFA